MKSDMKTNIKKIATLMLAILSLAALLSLLPEHNRDYSSVQAKAHQSVSVVVN